MVVAVTSGFHSKEGEKLKPTNKSKMVSFLLMVTADLENLTNVQPNGGPDDPSFSYAFKVKCERCGELSQKETWLSLNDTVPLPVGKGTVHLIQKCKFCERDGMITMIPGKGKPLTLEDSEAGNYVPIMQFDCRGYEPLDFIVRDGWAAESIAGTKYENIDLSGGDFVDYDEKGGCSVMISEVKTKFDVVK